MKNKGYDSINRRSFIRLAAAAIVSGPAILSTAFSKPKTSTGKNKPVHLHERPTMTYRKLGRTNVMSSRLVFGCGAALANFGTERLLDRAFEAGINHFDVGSNIAYKGSERKLAPFIKKHRGKVWVVSKGPAYVKADPEDTISASQARYAARFWTDQLEGSLKNLQSDHVDAYLLMGVNNPSLIRSEEVYNAFLKAKAAGKVTFFGLSTHNNPQEVLEAAIETGWYDLAMIGVTPAGWYDWDTKKLEDGTLPLVKLKGLLKKARDSGIGLIGLKTVRYLATYWVGGQGSPSAFDKIYDRKLMSAKFSPFQRAYAYVLEHGLDVVNADMQNFKHLEENIVAAATSHKYF